MLTWRHTLLRESLVKRASGLLEYIAVSSAASRQMSFFYGNNAKLRASSLIHNKYIYNLDSFSSALLRQSALAMLVRHQSSEAFENNYKKTTDSAKERVIAACNWRSPVFQERLGFASGYTYDVEELREHFFILAKHFHPDSASAPPNSTEAFQQIKLAYDVLYEEMKEKIDSGETYSKLETPQERKRLRRLVNKIELELMCFAIAATLFASLMTRNKLKSVISFVVTFVSIFTVVLFFPRILAATMLFIWQAVNSLLLEQSVLQKNAMVIVEKRSKELLFRLEGINDENTENLSTEVEILIDATKEKDMHEPSKQTAKQQSSKPLVNAENTNREESTSNVSKDDKLINSKSSNGSKEVFAKTTISEQDKSISEMEWNAQEVKHTLSPIRILSALSRYYSPHKVIPETNKVVEEEKTKNNEQQVAIQDANTQIRKCVTTLTFDVGVTKLVLPLPTPEVERHTSYHIKVKDAKRHTVVVDKTFQLTGEEKNRIDKKEVKKKVKHSEVRC